MAAEASSCMSMYPIPRPMSLWRSMKLQNFEVVRDRCAIKIHHQRKLPYSVGEVSAGDFSDDCRMAQNPILIEQKHQLWVRRAEMVNPDRAVRKDQAADERRRGISFSCGSVPPSLASRRAASRATRASSPIRTRVLRSLMPVSSCALATSSSSRFIVVRISAILLVINFSTI